MIDHGQSWTSGLGNDTSKAIFYVTPRNTSKTHVYSVLFYTQDIKYVEYVSQTGFCVNKEPNRPFHLE